MIQQPSTETIASLTRSDSPLGLSAQNVARLLSEDSPDARIDVVQKVAFEHVNRHLNPREAEIAEQIFRILMRDTETKVRTALAEAVKEDTEIPRDVVLHMAQDIDKVALPIIQYSEVLSESDLTQIISKDEDTSKQLAVAKRKYVSPQISSLLVETQKPAVVTELVGNKGADINEKTFQSIADTYSTHEKIVATLVNRDHVPLTVVEKLIHHASDKVSEELKRKYGLGEAQIKTDSERTRELTTLKLLERKVSSEELERLVEQMHVFARLTPSLVLTALCRGNLDFFEAVMARLAGVATRNAKLLIEDKGDLGFKALYEKAKLPAPLLMATRLVLNASLQLRAEKVTAVVGGRQWANLLVERVLALAGGRDIENLSYIIALIRQNNLH